MRPRYVHPEVLDSLPCQDPVAVRARLDLQCVHRAMGTRRILQRALATLRRDSPAGRPLRVLELGAGDGTLLLDLARTLAPAWPAVELTLLDRQALLSPASARAFAKLGWNTVVCERDAMDWAQQQTSTVSNPAAHWDLVLANLFMHHFEDPPLRLLLASVAASTDCFLACEPRRAHAAWVGSHLIGLLGVNAVTRKDAVWSVDAGFRAHELTALWPGSAAHWRLQEFPAGLFSHCFSAQRRERK